MNTQTFGVWGCLFVIRVDLWTRSFWLLFIFVSTPFIILVAFHTILGSQQNDNQEQYFYQNNFFLLDIRDGISGGIFRDIDCFIKALGGDFLEVKLEIVFSV